MSFDLTIMTKKVDKLKETFENGRFTDALVASLNTGNGAMQQRIFTQNKDTEGNDFGKYIGKKRKARLIVSENKTQNKRNKAIAGKDLTAYQRKRALRGRQITKKDLELEGDLRRSIEIQVESEKAVVLQFGNDHAAKVAKGQEAQIANIRAGKSGSVKGEGVRIFTLDKTEKETVGEQGSELIKQILK